MVHLVASFMSVFSPHTETLWMDVIWSVMVVPIAIFGLRISRILGSCGETLQIKAHRVGAGEAKGVASLTVVLLQLSRNRGNDKNLLPLSAPSQVAE